MPKALPEYNSEDMTKVAASRALLSSCTNNDVLSDCNGDGTSSIEGAKYLVRKRSFDDSENIPPSYDYKSINTSAINSCGVTNHERVQLSLLDLAAQNMSQRQRKKRKSIITASSPGGNKGAGANPRIMSQFNDAIIPHNSRNSGSPQNIHKSTGNMHRSSAIAVPPAPLLPLFNIAAAAAAPSPTTPTTTFNSTVVFQRPSSNPARQPQNGHPNVPTQSHHALRPLIPSNTSGTANVSSSAITIHGVATGGSNHRFSRLPKRNLKPLDFSGLHRPTTASLFADVAPNNPRPITGSTPFSINVSGTNSSILSLPVSPVDSSPIPIPLVSRQSAQEASAIPSSIHKVYLGLASEAITTPGSVHPTPPSTCVRTHVPFSGLLASAYQRASARRSKRTLNFEMAPSAIAPTSTGPSPDIESLSENDPILGPRCPVIGDPRGLFGIQKKGIDEFNKDQEERSESRFSEMARAVREAQAAFEAAVTEQTSRAHSNARRTAKSATGTTKPKKVGKKNNSTPAPESIAKPNSKQRPISECKYCGKQYKYKSKLASHEQHCSSRLEALLYSGDDNEQHVIHCVCGPRHDRPVGERDDLPMVQCDGCMLWLHIDCVGIDETNLPEEYFCPRCESRRGSGNQDDIFTGANSCMQTPKRKVKLENGSGAMSPESHRLATLLAGVPDDGSETEDEPMELRIRNRCQPRRQGSGKTKRNSPASLRTRLGGDNIDSEDTMSLSDVSEMARFHRQGNNTNPRSIKNNTKIGSKYSNNSDNNSNVARSPIIPRMSRSEADVSPTISPSRRRNRCIRRGSGEHEQTIQTDALSSDFLGMPLPESIFSMTPGNGNIGASLGNNGELSVAPGLYCNTVDINTNNINNSSQSPIQDLSQFLSDPAAPQWSLAQLSDMLGGSNVATSFGLGNGNRSTVNYVDQALADLGLGPNGDIAGEVDTGGGVTGTPLSELVDLPADNEFSALLESIASGNADGDSDGYSSMAGDSNPGLGSGMMLTDDIILGLNGTSQQALSVASTPLLRDGAPTNRRGSRIVSGIGGYGSSFRINDKNSIDRGSSSSTITLMQDSNGIHRSNSQTSDNRLPIVTRPPPGMPSILLNRNGSNKVRQNTRGSGGVHVDTNANSSMYNGELYSKHSASGGNRNRVNREAYSDEPSLYPSYSGASNNGMGDITMGLSATAAAMAAVASGSMGLPNNGNSTTAGPGSDLVGLDVSQLIDDTNSSQLLDWQVGGEALEKELEGLINFDV